MSVAIEPVRSPKQLDEFIKLPRRLYETMAGYVAPLDLERRELLDPAKSPFFQHGRAAYWIARHAGRAVGRISAQIDELAGPATPAGLGMFGCLDAIDDGELVAALLHTAEDWLRERHCRIVRGPFQLSINGESGLLAEGQDAPPMALLPWHPAYLDRHVRAAGYAVAMRLGSYVMNLHEMAPGALHELAPAQRPDIAISNIRIGRRNGDMEVARSIYNDGWQRNWGFVPAAASDTHGLARSFKPFLLPDSGFLVAVNGKPAAFALSIPNILDISADLGAAPGWRGWPRLIFRLMRRRYRSFRLVLIGVATEYHQTGLGHITLHEAVRRACAHGAREIACAWVLESNAALIRLLHRFGFRRTAIFHLYEKQLIL